MENTTLVAGVEEIRGKTGSGDRAFGYCPALGVNIVGLSCGEFVTSGDVMGRLLAATAAAGDGARRSFGCFRMAEHLAVV